MIDMQIWMIKYYAIERQKQGLDALRANYGCYRKWQKDIADKAHHEIGGKPIFRRKS